MASSTDTAQKPNANAATADFEFRALQEARNYRQSIVREFAPYLTGEVAEVGAGIGQVTSLIRQLPQVRSVLAIEPQPEFVAQHRQLCPGHAVLEGTVKDLPPNSQFDGIVSVNVLEHIEFDREELRSYYRLLAPRKGSLCLLVPARPEIYAPIDKDFGHFRRYLRQELREKLESAGFQIQRLYYFNWAGYFAWWLTCKVLKKRTFDAGAVRLYDRVIFPWVFLMESRLMRPPIGQSLIAIARATDRP